MFPDVANLPLRPPAVMAKAAASLDLISGGRFELGLGAGSFWHAISAMGGPSRTPREAGEALAEAIDVVRLMWSEQRSIRYDGTHYGWPAYILGPARRTRSASGSGSAGRRCSPCSAAPPTAGCPQTAITDGPSRGRFDGPVDQWVDTLTELVVEGGMDTFVFGAADDALGQARRFAEEVAPAARRAVEDHR